MRLDQRPPRKKKATARLPWGDGGGGFVVGSGDDRLSRRGHYHGPGGLNGRVRDGNGCGPAGMVAGSRPAGGQAPPAAVVRCGGHVARLVRRAGGGGGDPSRTRAPTGRGSSSGWDRRARARIAAAVGSRRRRVGVVKPSAVRTGRLRRSPAVHSRPIDLVVFQEPSAPCVPGNLVLKRASRLDAFSVYPFPTWLPSGAPSGTTGTPEVGPPQSSRTRGDPSQVSYAHSR